MAPDSIFPNPYPEEPKPAKQPASTDLPESSFTCSPIVADDTPISYEHPVDTEDNQDSDIWKNACLVVFVIVLILALIGGGVWYYLYKKGNKDAPKIEPPAKVEQSEKSPNLISAANGGRITLPDGAAVVVPPGALDKDTIIKMEKVEEGPVTDLYHLMPDGYEFLHPVTVIVPYKESGLAQSETPYDILLNYWFISRGAVRDLSYMVDQDGKTLQTQVAKF
ncbi:hypothetical protein HZA42_01015 [Candidatus Peregrinibacteria bacterium]|nr:hypothetical protein [Candidatus Peregrinibacteria bacterium]